MSRSKMMIITTMIIAAIMWMKPGLFFILGVHRDWCLLYLTPRNLNIAPISDRWMK
jgi:hypothetical protein